MGAPRKFPTEEDFLNKFEEYISYCEENKKIANIAGFAVYCKINRDTFYDQKERYPQAYNMIQDILEDYTINTDMHPTLKIFYLKCKFKYKDKPEEDQKDINRVTIVDDLDDTEN